MTLNYYTAIFRCFAHGISGVFGHHLPKMRVILPAPVLAITLAETGRETVLQHVEEPWQVTAVPNPKMCLPVGDIWPTSEPLGIVEDNWETEMF